MVVAGVTGTNGKTSTAHFIAQAWQRNGENSGMIGTIGYGPLGRLTVPKDQRNYATRRGLPTYGEKIAALRGHANMAIGNIIGSLIARIFSSS